jgi:predicted phosphohydrolase
MKNFIITALIVAATTMGSYAQKTKTINHGFWVAESNKNNPKEQTIRFYNDEEKLVYEEIISSKLDVHKKKNQEALTELCNKLYEQKEYALRLEKNQLITAALNLKH